MVFPRAKDGDITWKSPASARERAGKGERLPLLGYTLRFSLGMPASRIAPAASPLITLQPASSRRRELPEPFVQPRACPSPPALDPRPGRDPTGRAPRANKGGGRDTNGEQPGRSLPASPRGFVPPTAAAPGEPGPCPMTGNGGSPRFRPRPRAGLRPRAVPCRRQGRGGAERGGAGRCGAGGGCVGGGGRRRRMRSPPPAAQPPQPGPGANSFGRRRDCHR